MPKVEIDEGIPVTGEEVPLDDIEPTSRRPIRKIDPSTFFPKLYRKAIDFRGLGFQVVAIPTKLGAEQGLTPYRLIHRLLDWQEASRIGQHLSVEASFINPDASKLITIEPSIVKESEMSGMNYVFDPSQYEPEQWGGAHPAGNFDATISSTEVAQNSAGDGGNFVVEFTTSSGSIKKYYPLWSRNEKAVRGAHNQLTALCYAIGYLQKLDMNNGGSAIRGGKCKIQVGKQENSDYMEIKKVFDVQGNVPGKGTGTSPQQPQPTQPQQPQQPQQPAGFGGAPAGFGQPQQAPAGFGAPPQQAPQQAPQQWGGAPPQQPQQPQQWGGAPQQPAQPAQPQQPQAAPQWGGQPQQPAQPGGWQQGPDQPSAPGWSQ